VCWCCFFFFFFFSSRRRHTRSDRDWSSDVCSSDLSGAVYPVSEVVGGKIVTKTVPALTALNERLRDDYIDEIADGVRRWQRVIDQAGIPFRLTLPHKGFHREIGNFAGLFISPEGEALTEEAWKKHEFEWVPSPKDY